MNTNKQREHKVDTLRKPTLIVLFFLEPSSNQPLLMMQRGMGLQGLNPRPPVMSPSQSTLPLTMSSDCNLDTPTMLGNSEYNKTCTSRMLPSSLLIQYIYTHLLYTLNLVKCHGLIKGILL